MCTVIEIIPFKNAKEKRLLLNMNIWDKELNDIQGNQAYKDFTDGFSNFIKLCSMSAKGQKAYYDELLKEGFRDEQALKIVMAHGLFPGMIGKDQEQK